MQIKKILSRLFICVLCIGCFYTSPVSALRNAAPAGDVNEGGDWIGGDNIEKFHQQIDSDIEKVQQQFEQDIQSDSFVPIEAKLGLAFMYAVSGTSNGIFGNSTQNGTSFIDFVVTFLLVMYIFWVALEAWRLIHEGGEYKTVLYDIFKQGFIIAIWLIILKFEAVKLFEIFLTPIMGLSTYFSESILDIVKDTYSLNIPNTCQAIHQYVNSSGITDNELLLGKETAANIMCVPGRFSVYFYKAVGLGFKWLFEGFKIGTPTTQIFVGGLCVVMFVKCIFKYAFMTLGVVADLFLTLVMLPFTAIAESMPSTKENGYLGQTFTGFLKVLNTKKLSDVIAVFINAGVYFIGLSIIMVICALLLTSIVNLDTDTPYRVNSAMTVILGGCLILYLTGKAEELAKQIGGSIDNSLGTKWQEETKGLWGDAKGFGEKVYKDWLNKKK